MAPRQNARKKGRTAKTGEQTNAAGTQTRKSKRTQVRVGGVPCDYLIYLSEKKKETNKTKGDDDVGEKTKRKDKPKTPDLTSIEFFQTLSGAKKTKHKAKT